VTGTGKPAGSIRALQAPTGPNFTLFAGVNDDKVYSMTTGGVWTGSTNLQFGTPTGLAFLDDLTGWAVTTGVDGGVRFTIDGGVNWFGSGIHVPVDATTHALNAIWMNSGQTGFVVGANGVIMRTTTGGR
jgi:photosystem II stability/assembly factor-like uncharacterized protein